jgi:hypothetical protein
MTQIEKVLFEQAKKFALLIGKTEEEAIEEGYKKIAQVKKISEEEINEFWIDITKAQKKTRNYE